jgi:DNA repair exonuclease SbcCD nuclease subunit
MRSRLLENDFYERFAELFDRIAELNPLPDLVVHSGDLYDSPWEYNPSQPPVVAQETAMTVLKRFIEKTGISVLMLEGNHGLYRSLEVSLLDSLKLAVPGLDVATQVDLKRAFSNEEPLMFSYPNVDVFCFPFIEESVLESTGLVSDFNDWISSCQTPTIKKVSVGVAHGMTIDGSLHSGIFDMGFDYIALGHDHHQHKHAKNAWYAGSPERWRFDETRHEKGFLVVDIEHQKQPEVTPIHFEFARPVYNEKITIEPDDDEPTLIEKVEHWLEERGLKEAWGQTTSARIRLIFEGQAKRVSGFELNMAMESLRTRILAQDTDYNVSQLVWSIRQPAMEHSTPAYPVIDSEYLIEDPEEDFRAYLGTLEIDERYDETTLTKIAVRALKFSVSQRDERLSLEAYTEGEE